MMEKWSMPGTVPILYILRPTQPKILEFGSEDQKFGVSYLNLGLAGIPNLKKAVGYGTGILLTNNVPHQPKKADPKLARKTAKATRSLPGQLSLLQLLLGHLGIVSSRKSFRQLESFNCCFLNICI